jgi:hypothetical protein
MGDVASDPAVASYATTRVKIQAKRIIVHSDQDFTTGLANIGLVYLPINSIRTTNSDVAYLYLNDPSDSSVYTTYFFNQVVKVAGWGEIGESLANSPVLLETEVKIVDATTCQGSYPSADATTICVQSASTTAVQGACPNDKGIVKQIF